jgi:hypothetical protein
MPRQVRIPKVGTVEFPDSMSEQDVTQAAGDLHSKALVGGVMNFMAQDPSLQGLKSSEFHKEMSGLAAMLEKFPRLAQAVDAGMGQVKSVTPTLPVNDNGLPPAASQVDQGQGEEADEG